uniref:Uncharacterized protein n=1 Tax=Siphoviridae sp. ctrpM6 TaxID=2827956 RepID=A0A8S5T5J5_9CAUD|nr:MAG TPA: hypothetical protein [Siphoviridae sp. ctrpM6]
MKNSFFDFLSYRFFFVPLHPVIKLGCDSSCRFSRLPPWWHCQQWWSVWSFDAQREQWCR